MPQKKKLPFVTVRFVAVNVLVYVIRVKDRKSVV